MTRVFLADSQPSARSALRLLLLDLEMQVVGEADHWTAMLNEAALTQPDMIVVDWQMIPADSSLLLLRATCPAAVVIVLISDLDARHQAALSAGADSFISKDDTPDRVAERLRDAVANIRTHLPWRATLCPRAGISTAERSRSSGYYERFIFTGTRHGRVPNHSLRREQNEHYYLAYRRRSYRLGSQRRHGRQ
jgi:DNA-binding NarL/FixJ family response regulator